MKKEGGYIITNKTNFLIALPLFCSFLVGCIFCDMLATGINLEYSYRDEAMYFLLGVGYFTCCGRFG